MQEEQKSIIDRLDDGFSEEACEERAYLPFI